MSILPGRTRAGSRISGLFVVITIILPLLSLIPSNIFNIADSVFALSVCLKHCEASSPPPFALFNVLNNEVFSNSLSVSTKSLLFTHLPIASMSSNINIRLSIGII